MRSALRFGGPQIDRLGGPRDDGHARGVGGPARGGLVTHGLDGLRGRPDEPHAGVGDRLDELRPFGQEPVPRMHQGGLRASRGVHDRLDRQVGARGGWWADAERTVSHLHMERVAVRIGVDGDAGDAQLPAGADDAHRDLATVGDEDPLFGWVLHWSAILSGIRKGVNTAMVGADLERALRLAALVAPVRWDEVTGSTNETALQMAEAGTPEWTLVGANHQTDGQGPARPRVDRRPGRSTHGVSRAAPGAASPRTRAC